MNQRITTETRNAVGRLPDFIVAGAMRSGTSSLSHYLIQHPEIHLPSQKELHYFDRNFDKGLDWYRAWFSRIPEAVVPGEVTPSYMYFEDAVERMAATVPDARLIMILRDPVARTYSHYWYNRSHSTEHLPSFAEALAAEPERIAAGSKRQFGYVDRSMYFPQIQRISRLYPRERIYVLLFEDLVRDPAKTYSDVCSFIGVDPSFRPPDLGRTVNAYTTFRSLGLRKMGRSLPTLLRNGVGRLNARRDAEYPPMDREMRTMLAARFAEHNDALARWLGRDLSIWTA